MATRKYEWNKSEEQFEIAEDAGAALTTDFQFTVDIATVSNADGKKEILLGLEALKQYILEDTWPPA